MFFNVPDDLRGLDITNGQCVNSTVRQDVTFSYQGLPFGLSKKSSSVRASVWSSVGLITLGALAFGLVV